MEVKAHSTGIKPTMNLDTAAQAINKQQDIKVCELEEIIYNDFVNHNKKWSDLPSSPYTTTFGEGLMLKSSVRRTKYKTKRVGINEFQVADVRDDHSTEMGDLVDEQFSQNFGDYFEKVPIPLFSHIRSVNVERDMTMLCNCGAFPMSFCPCEHQNFVADAVFACGNDTPFKGFTHHDCGVRYLSSYMHLAYSLSTDMHIKKLFHKLAGDNIRGPKLGMSLPDLDVMHIEPKEPILSAMDRMKNYKKTNINMDLFDGLVSHTYKPGESMEDDLMYKLLEEQINIFNTGMT